MPAFAVGVAPPDWHDEKQRLFPAMCCPTLNCIPRWKVATRWFIALSGNDEVTVAGTQNVLATAHEMGLRRVVHLSSAGVYGNAAGIVDEKIARTRRGSAYAKRKIAAEQICEDVHRSWHAGCRPPADDHSWSLQLHVDGELCEPIVVRPMGNVRANRRGQVQSRLRDRRRSGDLSEQLNPTRRLAESSTSTATRSSLGTTISRDSTRPSVDRRCRRSARGPSPSKVG